MINRRPFGRSESISTASGGEFELKTGYKVAGGKGMRPSRVNGMLLCFNRQGQDDRREIAYRAMKEWCGATEEQINQAASQGDKGPLGLLPTVCYGIVTADAQKVEPEFEHDSGWRFPGVYSMTRALHKDFCVYCTGDGVNANRVVVAPDGTITGRKKIACTPFGTQEPGEPYCEFTNVQGNAPSCKQSARLGFFFRYIDDHGEMKTPRGMESAICEYATTSDVTMFGIYDELVRAAGLCQRVNPITGETIGSIAGLPFRIFVEVGRKTYTRIKGVGGMGKVNRVKIRFDEGALEKRQADIAAFLLASRKQLLGADPTPGAKQLGYTPPPSEEEEIAEAEFVPAPQSEPRPEPPAPQGNPAPDLPAPSKVDNDPALEEIEELLGMAEEIRSIAERHFEGAKGADTFIKNVSQEAVGGAVGWSKILNRKNYGKEANRANFRSIIEAADNEISALIAEAQEAAAGDGDGDGDDMDALFGGGEE